MTPEAANYAAQEKLRDGREITIRALRPDDRTDMLAAIDSMSPQSLRRRFFNVRRSFSEQEMTYFLQVDFVNHVALVATVGEGDQDAIVGGARYVVIEPGTAEIAFAVVDQYQGQGIGAALLRHLVGLARKAALVELVAEVLPENSAMLKVFQRSGLAHTTKRAGSAVHLSFRL
jgi:RimJ/RimL family protein N-acetyltransferase